MHPVRRCNVLLRQVAASKAAAEPPSPSQSAEEMVAEVLGTSPSELAKQDLHWWSERAQQIFDAIETDKSILTGLAGAHLFMNALMDKEKGPPNELLLQLKQGPLKHVKTHMCASMQPS